MLETSSPVSIADRPLKMLVADDDPMQRLMAEEWLSTGGNKLHLAVDGQQALDEIVAHRFDLIVLDLEMPRADGFDVLSELRADARHFETPVVVITGRRDTFAIDEAYNRGATSFVVKPVVWPLLTRQLRYVFNAERMSRGLNALQNAMA